MWCYVLLHPIWICFLSGKLNLVDLAGSERVSRSKADGARLKEAQNINKSLSCLGDVIHALRSKQNYVPYRNSKLTYLLQDSLGGDSKTLMITQVAPVRKNEGETICSLNFAQRVRNVELGAATRRFENGDILEVCMFIVSINSCKLGNKMIFSKISFTTPIRVSNGLDPDQDGLVSPDLGLWERSGSVVECLTRDRRAAGSSLTGLNALWSLSKTHLS